MSSADEREVLRIADELFELPEDEREARLEKLDLAQPKCPMMMIYDYCACRQGLRTMPRAGCATRTRSIGT